nr:hypothetical protein [uncultured Dyadobacter sp.]
MTRILISCLSVFLSINAFCQTDSVFLNQNPEPVLGNILINYKKEKITIRNGRSNPAFAFHEIRRIGFENGAVYVSQNVRSETQLLLLLSEGKFSLLYSEKEKLFYVSKNDSLLVISQAHFKRALPLIFGSQLTDEYYAKSNISPDYSASYLKKLTSYANQVNHSPEIVYQQSVRKFKKTVSLGPYIGFGYNRIAYDLYWENLTGVSIYKKSEFYSSTSIPIGATVDVALFKRVSIHLDAYFNQASNTKLDVDNMGTTKSLHPNSVLNSEKYAEDIKFTGYSYKTIHFDLAASYTLLREEKSKLRPCIFAGPSVVLMTSNETGIAVGYQEAKQDPYRYMTRYSELQRPIAMIAINTGLGFQYNAGDRLTFQLAGKYIHGLFPKLIIPRFSDKTENSIPMPDEAWGQLHHRFQNAYDQYTRMFTITGSLTVKL